MEYSGDILERIRAALIEYHAATASDGRKLPWYEIAKHLHGDFLPASDEDDENLTDSYKALAEALRRFAAGSQTPSKARLDAVCGYLKSKSYLTDGDLRPAEPGSSLLYALQAFFGATADPAARRSYSIAGTFHASRKNRSGRTEVSALTIREDGNGTTIVEDKVLHLTVAPQSTKRDALTRLLKRTGGAEWRFDGWLFQSQGQACIIVQDSLRQNPGIYTVLDRKNAPALANLVLVKSGDFGAPAPGYNREGLFAISADSNARDQMFARIRENIWEYRKEGATDGE